MDNLVSEISNLIKDFHQELESHLPALEKEIEVLIVNKNAKPIEIERYLDTFLSLSQHGIGNNLFVKLLEYYKNIDAEGARFYWEEYDKL